MTPRPKIEELIGEARVHLEPDWHPEREDGALRGVYVRKGRQRALRAAGAVLAACALAVVALHEVRAPRAPGAGGPPIAKGGAPAAKVLRLADGSVAEPLGAGVLEERTDAQGRAVLRLRGGARFRAALGPVRSFRVEVAGVAVEIFGTEFIVEDVAEGARVRAGEEGVRVLAAGQRVELAPGEERTFPRAPLPAPSTPAPAVDAPAAEAPRPAPARKRTWRTLAQDGQFERAYGALKDDGPVEEIDEPGDLLLLADVARLSRHPREAVAPLERLLRRHGADPRAPLAAFTLARVLLDDLGRPREAAASFARTLELDPGGPMAQDALAREVEAWSRAGDAARARERAEAYLRLYPEGRRLRSVRRFGGLD